MKITVACEKCGRRAKQWPLKNGKRLCMKHYNLLLQGKLKLDKPS